MWLVKLSIFAIRMILALQHEKLVKEMLDISGVTIKELEEELDFQIRCATPVMEMLER